MFADDQLLSQCVNKEKQNRNYIFAGIGLLFFEVSLQSETCRLAPSIFAAYNISFCFKTRVQLHRVGWYPFIS